MEFQGFFEKYEKKPVEVIDSMLLPDPLLSVCVQTFQQEDFIKKCLNGILMQETTFPFEILLGEDGSSDRTREICKEYQKKFPDKIRLFLHKKENKIKINGIPTGRFNFMYNLYSAKGKYIAFCEGDDFWTDSLKLQKQVDFLENNKEFFLTYHDAYILASDEKKVPQKKYLAESLKRSLTQEELMNSPYLLLFTICFRNKIKSFPKEFFNVLNGDYFLISLFGQYGKGKYLPTINPGYYRQHSGGIWSSRPNIEKEIIRLSTFLHLKEFYNRENQPKQVDHFQRKYTSQSYFLLDNIVSFSHHKKLISQQVRDKNFKEVMWYLLYKVFLEVTGRGHYLRKRYIKAFS